MPTTFEIVHTCVWIQNTNVHHVLSDSHKYFMLGINFSLEQNRFFKGTQAFANPTDLASSRCVGKCFPCPDTWVLLVSRKKISL